jgi:hypothetical protein
VNLHLPEGEAVVNCSKYNIALLYQSHDTEANRTLSSIACCETRRQGNHGLEQYLANEHINNYDRCDHARHPFNLVTSCGSPGKVIDGCHNGEETNEDRFEQDSPTPGRWRVEISRTLL